MRSTSIAIVGAGLSGLYAATLLERRGIDYMLIEARAIPGGRIASASHGPDRFDLGATWFWPDHQPELDRLVRELGLQRFRQPEAGDLLLERSPHAAPERVRGFASVPPSMRLAGGMTALVDALRGRIDARRIVTGQTVLRLRALDDCVAIETAEVAWHAGHVLLALPPRLLIERVACEPALPPALGRQWQRTATWMAPHAKYVAVYDEPFWRAEGLSGGARSACGPLAEIHDASTPGCSGALFGFFGLPAAGRRAIDPDQLRAQCRAQLGGLFGARAALPVADFIQDWAVDPHTATADDLQGAAAHAAAPPATAPSGPWHGRITGIASEWSPHFPGYLAGAIEAAALGVANLSTTESTCGR